MIEMRTFECDDCGHVWEMPFGTGRPAECPSCQSKTSIARKRPGRARLPAREDVAADSGAVAWNVKERPGAEEPGLLLQ